MVEWNCLFKIMTAMGFPEEFNSMVRLHFHDASAVKVNGVPSPLFVIERGVRQGWPFASYLFLIMVEVLNAMVVKEMELGVIKGIKLPFMNRQQIVAQYADDTSFALLGEEPRYKISSTLWRPSGWPHVSYSIGPSPVGTGNAIIHWSGQPGQIT